MTPALRHSNDGSYHGERWSDNDDDDDDERSPGMIATRVHDLTGVERAMTRSSARSLCHQSARQRRVCRDRQPDQRGAVA